MMRTSLNPTKAHRDSNYNASTSQTSAVELVPQYADHQMRNGSQ